jgi:quercetin dioxygenase-like cupin family protein
VLTATELACEGVAMTPYFVGDGCSNLFQVPAGKLLGQHRHKLGHHSFLILGRALLRDATGVRELVAPATVYLPADQEHEIVAVTDILWACTWPDAQGLVDADAFARSVTA